MSDSSRLTLSLRTKAQLMHVLAEFCVLQYNDKERTERINHIKKFSEVKKNQMRTLQELNKHANLDRTKSLALRFGERILENDNLEVKSLEELKEYFLITGACLFLRAATFHDRNGEDISKFMSVWFDNMDNGWLNQQIRPDVWEVPSVQFVPWINQLTSRVCRTPSFLKSNLDYMIQSVCANHPFHGLYQLKSVSISSDPNSAASLEEQDRLLGAIDLWQKLATFKHLKTTLEGISRFCEACVHVANVKVDKVSRCSLKVLTKGTGDIWGRGLKNLHIPPPTLHIPLRYDKDYEKVPVMTSALDEVMIAGGLSRPKIIKILSTDGSKQTMLLKGAVDDDLRQDAIMEQVFSQVNIFFKKYEPTRERNLSIKTYKVIPLNKTSGIIEFVKNTISLAEYLSKAHKKYRPKDMTEQMVRKKLGEVLKASNEKRTHEYMIVQNKMKPVLHMFFMEKFFSSDVWFESKVRYIRSTAAISILGHILGIGDRHAGNILLDEKTGETVHIDLGIAFDSVSLILFIYLFFFEHRLMTIFIYLLIGSAPNMPRNCSL